VVVSLWGATGMLRGAWQALEGGRPQLTAFSRWDGQAMVRPSSASWPWES